MHFYCQLLKWNTIPSWLKLWIHNTTQNHHNLIQQPVNIVNNRYYSLCKIWNNLLNSLPLVSHGCERINGKCHCKNNESNIIMFVVTSGHGPLALPETMSIISRLRPPHPSEGTPSYWRWWWLVVAFVIWTQWIIGVSVPMGHPLPPQNNAGNSILSTIWQNLLISLLYWSY